MYRNGPSIGGVIYLIIGVIVAANRGYLNNLTTLAGVLTALLGILLWPLLFFGINLHIGIPAAT